MKNVKDAIIIIGAGELQENNIRYAMEQDIIVYATDINKNAYCSKICDHFFPVSGQDIEALFKIAEKINNKYNFIGAMCFSEFGLESAALINERFKVKSFKTDVLKNCFNKANTKKYLNIQGINTPRQIKLEDIEKDKSLIPVVIKPMDSLNSRGITIVKNITELEDAIEEAKKVSDNIMIEEYIYGRHIGAKGIIINGEIKNIQYIERIFMDCNKPLPLGGIAPAKITTMLKKKIKQEFNKACNALGIENSMIEADLIIKNNKIYFIEINPQLDSGSTSWTFPILNKTNLVYEWLHFLKTGQYKINKENNTLEVVLWKNVYLKPGRIKKIIYPEDKNAGYFKLISEVNSNAIVSEAKSADNKSLTVWFKGCNEEDAYEKYNYFMRNLEVDYYD